MIVSDIVTGFTKRLVKVICPPFVELLFRGVQHTIPVREIRKRVDAYMSRNTPYIVKWIPESFYQTDFCQKVIKKEHRSLECVNMLEAQKLVVKYYWYLVYPAFWVGGIFGVLLHTVLSVCVYIFCEIQMENEYARYKLALIQHRDALTDYGRSLRDTWRGPTLLVGISLTTVAMVLIAWNLSRKKSGNKTSKDFSEADLKAAFESGWYNRGKEINPNGLAESIQQHDEAPGWFGFMMNKMHLELKNTTVPVGATPDHLVQTISPNVAWGQFKSSDLDLIFLAVSFFPANQ
jgi:hypothetical protein